jgi:hypothetical protein
MSRIFQSWLCGWRDNRAAKILPHIAASWAFLRSVTSMRPGAWVMAKGRPRRRNGGWRRHATGPEHRQFAGFHWYRIAEVRLVEIRNRRRSGFSRPFSGQYQDFSPKACPATQPQNKVRLTKLVISNAYHKLKNHEFSPVRLHEMLPG